VHWNGDFVPEAIKRLVGCPIGQSVAALDGVKHARDGPKDEAVLHRAIGGGKVLEPSLRQEIPATRGQALKERE
jgi:hypothetical protein